MAAIAWLAWSADAFARARAESKPVLLFLAPTWCRFSAEMERTSYADERVAALAAARFVPVRVDADRRPDLGQRYALGGWPTTAFLTPDGDLLGGGTFVEAARLADVLQRVSDAFASGRHVQGRRQPQPSVPASPASIDQLIAQVAASFDPVHGGFGGSPKFPHTAPVRLALELYRETGARQFHDIAVTSLDGMGWGPLYDEEHGGFFRYSHDADWGTPHREKLLDVNASLLLLYVEALETLGLARYGERAEDILRYVQTWLADQVDGGWAASQRDAVASEPAAPGESRSDAAVDRTLFADWNALMASAALRAGRVLDDRSLSEFAIRSLERVVLLCYKPGAGVAHYFDGVVGVRGLLDDQVAMALAHLDAFEATGNTVYEMMAEELALYATRTMWDGEGDGLLDRVADPRRDVGMLRQAVKPFAANCQAARMLQRVARTSSSDELAGYAQRTLAAMATRAAAEGPLAAEYVLAARETA